MSWDRELPALLDEMLDEMLDELVDGLVDGMIRFPRGNLFTTAPVITREPLIKYSTALREPEAYFCQARSATNGPSPQSLINS